MSSTGHRAKRDVLQKRACAPCRARRIRCNRKQPCNSCMIRGTRCVSPGQSSDSSSASSSNSDPGLRAAIAIPGSRTRKAGFHRFVRALDVYLDNLPIRTDVYFWRHGIIPAAVTYETIMNVLLCKEIINNLPKDQLMSAAMPASAIEYYVDSLSQPFKRLEDLPLLLMTSLMYIEIEWSLGHYQNLDILIQSTFRIIHSNLKLITSRYLRDHTFYCMLTQFLETFTESGADVSAIPIEMWADVHTFMFKYARKIQADALMFMELRLYELNFLSQRSNFDALVFGYKLATWEHEMIQLERIHKQLSKNAKWLDHMGKRAHPARLFWNAYLYHTTGDPARWQVLRATVEESATKLEMLLNAPWVNSPQRIQVMHIQVFLKIIPRIAVYISYARDIALCQRLLKVLDIFRPCIVYYAELSEYLETMARTEYGKHTALEFAYLGADLPLILWKWQISRVVDQIASRGIEELLKARSLPIIQPKVIA